MAQQASFDVSTGCDIQEVDNAINQANKELSQRYDFRGVAFKLDLKRDDNELIVEAPDDFKLSAIWDIAQTKLIKRNVACRNFRPSEVESASGGTVRQKFTIQQGIETDTAKKIVKFIKDKKLKKVQASIQGDQVRIVSPSRDMLQDVQRLLSEEDFGIELNYGNYR
jgi:hypothetical protein